MTGKMTNLDESNEVKLAECCTSSENAVKAKDERE